MRVHVDLRMSARSGRATVETLLAVTVQYMARHCGWNELGTFKINLALDELITNIFSYGESASRQAPQVSIHIIVSDGGRTNITVSDDSYRFDPVRHAPAEIAAHAGKESGAVPVGGYGIGLVKDIAEHISYLYENGKNWITLSIPGETLECSAS